MTIVIIDALYNLPKYAWKLRIARSGVLMLMLALSATNIVPYNDSNRHNSEIH